MTEIPEHPFNKIAIDLVTGCETSSSGNKHILTTIDHLTGWPEAFPIPDKSADTIVSTFINQDLTSSYVPQIYTVGYWHGVQKPYHGSSTSTTRDLLYILCTLPPSKKWKIRSLSQVPQTHHEEAM